MLKPYKNVQKLPSHTYFIFESSSSSAYMSPHVWIFLNKPHNCTNASPTISLSLTPALNEIVDHEPNSGYQLLYYYHRSYNTILLNP